MAEPTLDQRTPICRLKYEADDTRNYNWSKIDDTIGRAFTPSSPLQIAPGSIQGSMIAPEAISSDLIFPGETVPGYGSASIAGSQACALNVPLAVATISALSGNPRGGPTLVTGVLPLTFFNSAASPATCAFNVDLLVYGVATPLAHFAGFIVNAGIRMPILVPLSAMIQAPSGFPTSPALVVQVTKTTGADATEQLVTADSGSVQMSELA